MMAAYDNFLQNFLKLGEGTEVPPTFMLWCGMSAISTAIGRKAYVDLEVCKLYPNLYTVLVAGSGRCRKSTAISMAENLIRRLDPQPNLISQKTTAEGLLVAMQTVNTTDPHALLATSAEGHVIADELATFLNQRSYDGGLGEILTPLYDCKDFFNYRTKTQGYLKLENVYLGILGGATVGWLREILPIQAIGGGLVSRFLFVYCDQPMPPVAFPKKSQERENLKDKLAATLQQISQIRGEFKLSDRVIELHTETYNSFCNSPMFLDKNMEGYASRRGDHLLKLAMIFSASQSTNMLIEENHYEAARVSLASVEAKLPHLISLIITSDKGILNEEVLRYMKQKPRCSMQEIIRNFAHKASAWDVQSALKTLTEAGIIQMTTGSSGCSYRIIQGS